MTTEQIELERKAFLEWLQRAYPSEGSGPSNIVNGLEEAWLARACQKEAMLTSYEERAQGSFQNGRMMTPEQAELEKKAFEVWWKQQARPSFADDGFQHDAGSRAWLIRSQIAEDKLQRIREIKHRGVIHYGRDLGEPDPTPAFPTHVRFSVQDWDELEKELKG